MPRPYTTIYVRIKTAMDPGKRIRPDFPSELLQHTIRTTHAYRPDFVEAVSRIEVENTKLGAFRSELERMKSKGLIEEIVPTIADRLKYRGLDRVMDPKNNPNPFENHADS